MRGLWGWQHGSYRITAATLRDADFMARHARPEDVLEWERGQDTPYVEAIGHACASRETCAVRYESKPLAVYGILDVGVVEGLKLGSGWLILADFFQHHLLGLQRAWFAQMQAYRQHFHVIDALCDSENAVHREWLERGGFVCVKETTIRAHPFSLYRLLGDRP